MNFFDRILHYYIYDMRLKKKLVVSHTILFLLPTAVLICFLFLNIFRIVIDDALRSEQALSSQSVPVSYTHLYSIVFQETQCEYPIVLISYKVSWFISLLPQDHP